MTHRLRSIAAFRGDPVVFLVGGKVRDEEGYGGVEGIVGMGETPMLHAMIAAMILLLGWFQDSRPMYSLLQQYPPCRMGQGYCKERFVGPRKINVSRWMCSHGGSSKIKC